MYSIIVDAQIKMKWSIVPTVTTGILSRGMHEPSLGSARRCMSRAWARLVGSAWLATRAARKRKVTNSSLNLTSSSRA